MAECARHPATPLPYCYWCRTGTEPGGSFVPPSQARLEADTEEALVRAREMAAGLGPSATLDGMVAIIGVQFPDVPAATLGRIVVSAAMAAGSVVKASAFVKAGRLDGGDVVDLLAMAGARLAGEDAPHV